jgi:hypothetical protein
VAKASEAKEAAKIRANDAEKLAKEAEELAKDAAKSAQLVAAQES